MFERSPLRSASAFISLFNGLRSIDLTHDICIMTRQGALIELVIDIFVCTTNLEHVRCFSAGFLDLNDGQI